MLNCLERKSAARWSVSTRSGIVFHLLELWKVLWVSWMWVCCWWIFLCSCSCFFFSCWCGMILVFKAGVSLRCSTRFLFLCNEEKKNKTNIKTFSSFFWQTRLRDCTDFPKKWSRIINSRTKGRVDFLSLYSPPLPCFRWRICKFATFLDHVPYQVTECWLGSSKNDEGYIECIIFSQQKINRVTQQYFRSNPF